MLPIIKKFGAYRSFAQLPGLTERFVRPCITRQLNGSGLRGLLSLQPSFEVRPKRLFASTSNRDRDEDPLSSSGLMYPLNDAQKRELTSNDPTMLKKIQVLQMELAVKKVQSPHSMPMRLSLEHWKNLITLSRTGQTKYLLTLKKKEGKYQEVKRPEIDVPADYDLADYVTNAFDHKIFRNALFPMVHPNTITLALNSRLVEAVQFSSTVVMDCGFQSTMSVREIKNLCQQLASCLNVNKHAIKPVNLVFCNLEKDSLMGQTLWSAVPNIYEDHIPVEVKESCYTELYPKDRLVYLTPHVREQVEYDPNDIYIIGAIVDKSNPAPHSLIKAKSQGIRMRSFPIDKYLVWKQGTKSLTINQVLSILLTMAYSRSWAEAFKVVPRRKIVDVIPFRGFDKSRPRRLH